MVEDFAQDLDLDFSRPGARFFEEQVAYEAPGTDDGFDFVNVEVAVESGGPPRLWVVWYVGVGDPTLVPPASRLLDLAVAARRARVRLAAQGARARVEGAQTDVVWSRRLRQRNRPTDELYEQTAELYLAGGAQAVADGLYVSRRQASRYVKNARERGLLT